LPLQQQALSRNDLVAEFQTNQTRLMRSMIAEMPDLDREILLLRHVEEMTVSEAAAELNISVEAAKKRHLRAIRRLQTSCDGLNGSGIR